MHLASNSNDELIDMAEFTKGAGTIWRAKSGPKPVCLAHCGSCAQQNLRGAGEGKGWDSRTKGACEGLTDHHHQLVTRCSDHRCPA